MASLNDSVNMNTDNIGPVVAPNPAQVSTPPINYGSTTTRTTFPQPVPASPDVLGLWNARSSGLPTRGRLLPVSNTVVASATSNTTSGSGTGGAPGAAGATGAAGTRGSLWYEGAGAPGTITGQMNNDFYLNTTNGAVYVLVAGVWTLEMNITGPAGTNGTNGTNGINGTDGVRGSLWYSGTGAPGTIAGQLNNDFYLNTTNGAVYELVAGVWTLELNITGPAGAAGATGAAGTRGSLWYEGAGAPGTITGQMNNDFYLNTSNGDVYELVAGVWTLELNITGPAGAAGSTGGQVSVTQSNSFSAGQAIYFNGTIWVLAQANAAGTLGVALVSSSGLSGSAFIAVFMGQVTGLSGLTSGQYYFVSDATPGALTTTEPTNTSSYSNPIVLALSTTMGFVLPFRPNSIVKQQTRVVAKTANYNAVAGDIIFCDTSAGGFSITLPLSSTNPSAEIIVKKKSADGNAVTIKNSGSDTVDLSTTNYILDQQGDALDAIADGGTLWGIV